MFVEIDQIIEEQELENTKTVSATVSLIYHHWGQTSIFSLLYQV